MTREQLEDWLNDLRLCGSIVDHEIISYDEKTGVVVARITERQVLKEIKIASEPYQEHIDGLIQDIALKLGSSVRRKHPDPTPEMEATLIAAWHSLEPKANIRTRLDVSLNYLEAMWVRLRKANKIPQGSRPGAMRGRPQGGYGMVEKDESVVTEHHINASDELLRLLREHHGCDEERCGRLDVPASLIKVERRPLGTLHLMRSPAIAKRLSERLPEVCD